MPKLTRAPQHHRYSASSIPVSLAPSTTAGMSYYNAAPAGMPPAYYTTDVTTSAPQGTISMPTQYDPFAVAPLSIPSTGPPVGGPVGPMPSLPAQHRASSGAWSKQDDETLLRARASGQNWGQIQASYFTNKTANACRKRHERLMERRGADDWDQRKLERLSKEYMSMRKEIWQGLAQRCGEKWNVVEHKCMSNGLKNIQRNARNYVRRERLDTGGLPPLGYDLDDDSGVSGIGLTPVDDLDVSYSSPESVTGGAGPGSASSSAGSVRGGYSSHHHVSAQHQAVASSSLHPQSGYHHQGYSYGHHHPAGGHHYTSSVSSTGTAAYAATAGHTSQSASPYLDHSNRLPSVDMGIDAIINRNPNGGGGL